MDKESWNLYNMTRRKHHPHDISFNDFVNLVASQTPAARDLHWRSQVDFLLFKEYDEYYCLENFATVQSRLLDAGFTIYDSRRYLQHDTASIKNQKIQNADQLSAFDLLKMKREGHLPDMSSLFTSDIYQNVCEIFKDDINLYTNKFGTKNLYSA